MLIILSTQRSDEYTQLLFDQHSFILSLSPEIEHEKICGRILLQCLQGLQEFKDLKAILQVWIYKTLYD